MSCGLTFPNSPQIEKRATKMSEIFPIDAGLWSDDHRQPCKVVECAPLWDKVSYAVWFPSSETIVRVTTDKLKALSFSDTSYLPRVRYVLFAARIANLLNEYKLLGPGCTESFPYHTNLRRCVEPCRRTGSVFC